jgi:subtilisin family serine protease
MMNRSVVLSLIIGFFLGYLLSPAVAQAESARTKLSPHLQMLISGNTDLVETAKRHVHLRTAPEYTEPMVDTLVLFQGDPKAVEAYGARVRSVLGNVATVDIPLSTLEMIANHPNVIRIEEARKLKPRLDVSVPASGANGVWGTAADPPGSSDANLRPLPPPWTGNTGQNVVVGLVDTGIDLSHLDFKDTLGKSRVLYVWDQTVNGTKPAGFFYGNECTKQQIDAGTCSQADTDGHGTHVAGIAAGNGLATGNSKPAYRYIGMAPQANLIVVNSTFFDTDIVDGITYIQNKAAALFLPSVINLSLGSHFGPHDGTSNFEAAMDSASGTGKVIVAAAGNEAAADIHASGTVANGGTTTVGFSVSSGETDILLDLWYPGADQIGVKVTSPSSTCTIPVSGFRYPGNADQISNTTCGQIVISTPVTNSANGDHEIIVELQNIGAAIKAGTWTFTLTGSGCGSTPCVTNGAFDVWVDDVSSNAIFSDHIDTSKTVGMPATATEAIAVGAYTTKTSWPSSNGLGTDSFGTVGDITFFSSLGPRRTCSNGSNPVCTAVVQKPELAAPGEEIMSSHAAGTLTTGVCFAASNQCLDPDGQHIVFQGTSMSTPHVTGATALLLAQNATLTSDQVKTALELTRTDSFTGSTPNNTWGYGKLAVDLAIAGVGSSPPLGHTPSPPTVLSAVAGPDLATISWTGITNDIYLDGYNVYESTASGGPYTKANSNIVSTNSFTVTGLTAGTPYFFVVTRLDTPNLESIDSTKMTATPTTPSSGGGGCGMIDLRRGGPSNPFEPISYLLTLFLPLVLIRLLRRRRDWNRVDLARHIP